MEFCWCSIGYFLCILGLLAALGFINVSTTERRSSALVLVLVLVLILVLGDVNDRRRCVGRYTGSW